MQALTYTLAATVIAGPLAVLLAASLSLTVLRRWAAPLVAFSVGLLLSAAFLRMLPEALHELDAHTVGACLLAGLGAFFLLERIISRGGRRSPAHGRATTATPVLLGDGIHNFTDGVIVSAAFLESPALGMAATIAILAHELPQETADFMVLLSSGCSRGRALAWNGLTSLTAVVGGVFGWAALEGVADAVPYALCVSAASFIYVAASHLLPRLQAQPGIANTALQCGLMMAGAGAVLAFGAH